MVKFRKPFNAGLVLVTLLLSASALATGLRNLALTAAVGEAVPAFPSGRWAARLLPFPPRCSSFPTT